MSNFIKAGQKGWVTFVMVLALNIFLVGCPDPNSGAGWETKKKDDEPARNSGGNSGDKKTFSADLIPVTDDMSPLVKAIVKDLNLGMERDRYYPSVRRERAQLYQAWATAIRNAERCSHSQEIRSERN